MRNSSLGRLLNAGRIADSGEARPLSLQQEVAAGDQ